MICVVINDEEVPKGADLIELRLSSIEKRKSCLPFIAKAEKEEEIEKLLSYSPDYLDLDWKMPLPKNLGKTKLILSYHDYEKTPTDLLSILNEMRKKPADLYKIALFSNQTNDALRLISFAKKQKDVLPIAMGSYGQVSRLIPPLFDFPFTYACINDETAPGQLTLNTLHQLYRYKRLSPKTKLFGLIGDPVTKSISDVTHNQLEGLYIKMQVAPSQLGSFLQEAKKLFQGLSVTMPLKEAILPFLDEVDQDIGAVNTLRFEGGKIYGTNTDGIGALNALGPVQGKKVLIAGAGGAARAILYEAKKRGAHVTITNRTQERVKKLAAQFDCSTKLLPPFDIIINCTPADLPIDPELFHSNCTAMDIRTCPKMTPFLEEAQKRGCKLVYGYEMFVEQALYQYLFWLGESTPLNEMRKTLMHHSHHLLKQKELAYQPALSYCKFFP